MSDGKPRYLYQTHKGRGHSGGSGLRERDMMDWRETLRLLRSRRRMNRHVRARGMNRTRRGYGSDTRRREFHHQEPRADTVQFRGGVRPHRACCKTRAQPPRGLGEPSRQRNHRVSQHHPRSQSLTRGIRRIRRFARRRRLQVRGIRRVFRDYRESVGRARERDRRPPFEILQTIRRFVQSGRRS